MSLDEVARQSGKHTSQLSRLERQQARDSQPKLETIDAILDALEATPAERKAVFHVELPPITSEEVAAQVESIDAEYDRSPRAVVLLDDRWFRRYLNPAACKLFGITEAEYRRVVGDHVLLHLIDPTSPIYGAYPEDVRRRVFSMRVAAFQFYFADQQFDSWYLRLAEEVARVFWAWQIWQSPPDLPTFPDSQQFTLQHRTEGILQIRTQLNRLMLAPRFTLAEMAPADSDTARKMARIVAQP